MSSIGGVLFDRDATYIDLGGSHHLGGGRLTSGRQRVVGAGEAELAMARQLMAGEGASLEERLARDHTVRMFADAPPILTASEAGHNGHSSADSSSDSSSSEESDDEDDVDGGGVKMLVDTEAMIIDEKGEEEEDESEVFLRATGKKLTALPNGVPQTFDSRHRDLKEAFDSKSTFPFLG